MVMILTTVMKAHAKNSNTHRGPYLTLKCSYDVVCCDLMVV